MPSTTEIIVLSVLGLAVLALGVRAFRPRRTVAKPVQTAPISAGRLLIDTIQEVGKNRAGMLVEERLGAHEAQKFMLDMAAAFGAAAPTPTPPPSPAPTPPSPNG